MSGEAKCAEGDTSGLPDELEAALAALDPSNLPRERYSYVSTGLEGTGTPETAKAEEVHRCAVCESVSYNVAFFKAFGEDICNQCLWRNNRPDDSIFGLVDPEGKRTGGLETGLSTEQTFGGGGFEIEATSAAGHPAELGVDTAVTTGEDRTAADTDRFLLDPMAQGYDDEMGLLALELGGEGMGGGGSGALSAWDWMTGGAVPDVDSGISNTMNANVDVHDTVPNAHQAEKNVGAVDTDSKGHEHVSGASLKELMMADDASTVKANAATHPATAMDQPAASAPVRHSDKPPGTAQQTLDAADSAAAAGESPGISKSVGRKQLHSADPPAQGDSADKKTMYSVDPEEVSRVVQAVNRFRTIAKSRAKQQYLLTEGMLAALPFMEKKNPKRPSWSAMKLYRLRDIIKASLSVYGTFEQVKEAVQRRAARLQVNRRRAQRRRRRRLGTLAVIMEKRGKKRPRGSFYDQCMQQIDSQSAARLAAARGESVLGAGSPPGPVEAELPPALLAEQAARKKRRVARRQRRKQQVDTILSKPKVNRL